MKYPLDTRVVMVGPDYPRVPRGTFGYVVLVESNGDRHSILWDNGLASFTPVGDGYVVLSIEDAKKNKRHSDLVTEPKDHNRWKDGCDE